MRGPTFGAHLALIFNRWPWPDEAKEAKRDYQDRLWAKVCDWTGDRIENFKKGVGRLVADPKRFGRPSVEDIMEACRIVTPSGGRQQETEEERREAERLDCIYELRKRLETGQIGPSSKIQDAAAFGPWVEPAIRWAWQNLVFWRGCSCGFNMALRLGLKQETEMDERGHRVSTRTLGAWYRCLGCRRKEPVFSTERPQGVEIDGGPLDRLRQRAHAGGFRHSAEQRKEAAAMLRAWHEKNRARMAASPMFGPDPFRASPGDIDEALSQGEPPGGKADRAKERRERSREDAEDRRDGQADDFPFENIPF